MRVLLAVSTNFTDNPRTCGSAQIYTFILGNQLSESMI